MTVTELKNFLDHVALHEGQEVVIDTPTSGGFVPISFVRQSGLFQVVVIEGGYQ